MLSFFPARLVPQQYHSNTTAPFPITSLNGSLVHWLGIEHTKILDVGDAQDLVVITFDTRGPPTQPHVLSLA